MDTLISFEAATIAEGSPRATSVANVGPDKVANRHVGESVCLNISRIMHNEFVSMPFPAFIMTLSGFKRGAIISAIFLIKLVGTTMRITLFSPIASSSEFVG